MSSSSPHTTSTISLVYPQAFPVAAPLCTPWTPIRAGIAAGRAEFAGRGGWYGRDGSKVRRYWVSGQNDQLWALTMPTWDDRGLKLTSSSNQSFRLFLAYKIFLTFPDCFFFPLSTASGTTTPPKPISAPALAFESDGTKDEAGMSVGLVRCPVSYRSSQRAGLLSTDLEIFESTI